MESGQEDKCQLIIQVNETELSKALFRFNLLKLLWWYTSRHFDSYKEIISLVVSAVSISTRDFVKLRVLGLLDSNNHLLVDSLAVRFLLQKYETLIFVLDEQQLQTQLPAGTRSITASPRHSWTTRFFKYVLTRSSPTDRLNRKCSKELNFDPGWHSSPAKTWLWKEW